MILTVTPDPGPDRTYGLPAPARGAVLRAGADRVDPGKGVNVSRAVVPLGGPEGEQLARLLGERGIEAAGVPIAGSTRVNITLVEPDGTLTKVNAAGPEISGAEAEALPETARARPADADRFACCGSLPRGLRPEWYAGPARRVTGPEGLLTDVAARGARVPTGLAGGGLTASDGGSLEVMAAVMAVGMVSPPAMASATTVRGRPSTEAGRENGKAARALGAPFITEGATSSRRPACRGSSPPRPARRRPRGAADRRRAAVPGGDRRRHGRRRRAGPPPRERTRTHRGGDRTRRDRSRGRGACGAPSRLARPPPVRPTGHPHHSNPSSRRSVIPCPSAPLS